MTAPLLPATAAWMFVQPSCPEPSVEVIAAIRFQPLCSAKVTNARVWLVVEFEAE